MIRIFIGSAHKWAHVEPVLEHSIRKHSSEPVEINWMRPRQLGLTENGCTGFTMFRYCIPELAQHKGFAIYLDVDMLLLDDIAELWQYQRPGRWAMLEDGSSEVMVIDCSIDLRLSKHQLCAMRKWEVAHLLNTSSEIPLEWNCEDELLPGAKLLHFTDLERQPWDYDIRQDDAAQLWRAYADEIR